VCLALAELAPDGGTSAEITRLLASDAPAAQRLSVALAQVRGLDAPPKKWTSNEVGIALHLVRGALPDRLAAPIWRGSVRWRVRE
jgi:hypothetical protein